jgi:hypothetical protein
MHIDNMRQKEPLRECERCHVMRVRLSRHLKTCTKAATTCTCGNEKPQGSRKCLSCTKDIQALEEEMARSRGISVEELRAQFDS